nr:hypothetical protein [uncultured Arsenicibacter sp.]
METLCVIVVDSNMVSRFRLIQTALGVKTSEIAARSGVSDDKLYQFLSGRQNLTLESLRLIKQAYPALNTDYLISGEGSPLRTGQPDNTKELEIYVPEGIKINVFRK